MKKDKRKIPIYKNISEHGRCTGSLFKLVKDLLDNKIIKFTKGEYKMNRRLNMAVWGDE